MQNNRSLFNFQKKIFYFQKNFSGFINHSNFAALTMMKTTAINTKKIKNMATTAYLNYKFL